MARPPETAGQALDRLTEERDALEQALLAVVRGWADLENQLALLLDACLTPQPRHLAFVIYFTPSNMETRIAIVDGVVRGVLESSQHADISLSKWSTLKGKIDRQKGVRNAAIHGQVSPTSSGGRLVMRLTPLIADVTKRRRQGHQAIGQSAADLRQHASAIGARKADVELFARLVQAVKEEDDASCRDALRKLEGPASEA